MEERRSRIWLLVLGAVLLAGGWFFLYKDALFAEPSAFEKSISEKVPDVSVILMNGEETTLQVFLEQEFSKNPNAQQILLSFWATWCAPCLQELPLLQERSARYTEAGTEIVLLNFDSAHQEVDQKKVLEWLETYAPQLRTVFDPRDKLIETLELSALPFNAIVDRNLKWVWGEYGTLQFEKIEKEFIFRPRN